MRQRLGFVSKLILIIATLALVFMFFRLNRPSVALVMDRSFSIAYPDKAINSFRKNLRHQGYRLFVITADSEAIMDGPTLEKLLSGYTDCALVLTTPVISTAVKAGDINLSALVKGLAVGMTADNTEGCFDIILPADFDNMPEGTYYTDAIGKKDVQNLVYPDLSLSVIPLLNLDKDNLTVVEGVSAYEVG